MNPRKQVAARTAESTYRRYLCDEWACGRTGQDAQHRAMHLAMNSLARASANALLAGSTAVASEWASAYAWCTDHIDRRTFPPN